jgi:O-antigen biosynthesis protein
MEQSRTLPQASSSSASVGKRDGQGANLPLSLCMIVRDAARTLPAALESIRPYVDEMVVVDTGSADDTAAIAERFGARVLRFAWCDDFAAARNTSLAAARGEWLFWMDADDTIDERNGIALKRLSRKEHPAALLGFVLQVRCPPEEGTPGCTVVDHVKVLRNRSDVRFEGRIHEQVLPSIRRAHGQVAWTDIFVVHSGADQSPAGRERKWARDLGIIRKALSEEPDSTFMWFNLGMTLCDAGDYEGALNALCRSLHLASPEESHVRKIYSLLVEAYQALGRYRTARVTCRKGLEQFPDDDELRFRSGILAQLAGEWAVAEASFLEVLKPQTTRRFASVDSSIKGSKAWVNLANVYRAQGKAKAETEAWRRAAALEPSDLNMWQGLVRASARCGELPALQSQLTEMESSEGVSRLTQFLGGLLCAARGDFAKAERQLEDAATGAGVIPLEALCKLCFEQQRWDSAVKYLERLAALGPECPATQHNLGIALLKSNRPQGAREAFARSLRCRPDHPPTLELLRICEHEIGDAEAGDAMGLTEGGQASCR